MAPSIHDKFLAEFRQMFEPRKLLPILTAGLVIGLMMVIVEISFGALIFSGDLSGFLSRGIGLTLFGTLVILTIMALTSTLPGTIAVPQDTPVAILALMAATISSSIPAGASDEEIFLTVVAAIVLTTFLTGAFFLALGYFKLGNLVRFIPYPVIGGFLAGSGLVLTKGATGFMSGFTLNLTNLHALFQYDILMKWLPGFLFAVLLLVVVRRFKHFLIMPSMVLGAIGLFYLIIFVTNTSMEEIGVRGWLLGPFDEGGLWQPLAPAFLTQVNWGVIFGQVGHIGSILILSVISLLLSASGLELIVGHDVDLNGELRSAGIANLLAGLGGSPVGYHALSGTAIAHKMGANSRLVGLVAAAMFGAVMLLGTAFLSFFPMPLMGGLLLFLGLSFLVEWVYDAWFKLPRMDYFLVLLILAVIGLFGFLEGIAAGVLVAVVLFVVKYSRINVVKHVLTGVTYHSNVERSVPHQRLLRDTGEQLYILKLQGFIFFGTANNLFTQVKERATSPDLPKLSYALLDFRHVSGLDSSGMNSFIKMKLLQKNEKFNLIFTNLSADLERQFKLDGIGFDTEVQIFATLDQGVEWCENQILSAEIERLTGTSQDAQRQTFVDSVFDDWLKSLEQQEMFESVFHGLMNYMERREAESGCFLLRQGEPIDALYYIELGQVTEQVEGSDGQIIRLRRIGPGSVIGELGLYLGQSAPTSVVTNQNCTVYRFTMANLKKLEDEVPELAATFHKVMAQSLVGRLADTNRTLQTLMD